MLTHHVLFWLKPELDQQKKEAFRRALESLQPIKSISSIYIGTPAPLNRPVIDTTYDFSLLIVFNGLEEHDAYQVDPVHKAFVENFKTYWNKVVIYDSQ